MKKIIIPVLVLALAGAGWYFTTGKNNSSLDLGGTLKQEAFKGTMAAAVKLGIPMKCSYSIDDTLDAEGYIKGKNYRGKMKAENGEPGEVVMKDNCMWNWSEETKEGTKFCFEEGSGDAMWGDFNETDVEELDAMEAPEGFETSDVEFDCKPTVVSDSMFTPPADVKFVDMAKMFEDMMPEGMDSSDFGSMDSNVDIEKLKQQYGQ